jgi:orotate phosphoribosyltransferase
MNSEQVLGEFRKAGALLEGHFVLSSGMHSDVFLQKSLVFQDAKRTAKLCKALADRFPAWDADKLPPHLKDTIGIKPGSRGLA